jgi:hypothetical protein
VSCPSTSSAGGTDVFEHESAGAAAQRLEDILVFVEGGHDEDPGSPSLVVIEDDFGGFQAVHHGHADVHQHDVGLERLRLAHRLDTGSRSRTSSATSLGLRCAHVRHPGPRPPRLSYVF